MENYNPLVVENKWQSFFEKNQKCCIFATNLKRQNMNLNLY